jgi:protein transport protein SEC20
VSSLINSQKSDTWYLESAFWILVSTIVWLIFRRFLYGPGWWLLYLPTKLIWKLIITLIHISFGSLAIFSRAQPQTTDNLSTSLIIKPSATGGPPRFHSGMSAPYVAVGGGGAGAKDQQYRPLHREDKSLSEAIGKMAEDSRQQGKEGANEASREGVESATTGTQQGTVLRERRSDEPSNPKKRMWEENTDMAEQGQTVHDEL